MGLTMRPPLPTHQLRRDLTAALQRFLERHPEFAVEVGVDERVQSRVEVADPEHEGHNPRRAVAHFRSADCCYYVPGTKIIDL